MSFLKYAQDAEICKGNGRGELSFRRAHIDGAPFRGRPALLKEEEYEQYTETVRDAHVKVFDLSKEDDVQQFQDIVDGAANQWYKVHRMQEKLVEQPDGSVKCFVFCIWTIPFKELARHRMPGRLR